jgi:hypothetical protein
MAERKYDTTVARIAGDLLSGAFDASDYQRCGMLGSVEPMTIQGAVLVARAIVAEVLRTDPAPLAPEEEGTR